MEPVVEERTFSGRYQLTHLVARGGMAQVYRAHDQLLDRTVALKVLFPELSVDPTFVERFRREAQSAAKLSHPNIVPVFDWGEDGGTYFIVMEFIDGEPLSSEIRDKGQIEPTRAAMIASSVAAALDYAHRRGVVHRDIKPGNVLLTEDGQVKVTDFGIARALNTEENLTQVGSVMGTATYFSPEQAEGRVVDTRSDLYSLGIVLYEMLVGRPPFIGDSPVAVASKHVRELAPMPRVFNATIPVGIEAVTMKAIAKRPEDRYQHAGEFREDLLRYVNGEPVLAPDPEAAHRNEVDATTSMDAINRTQAVPVFTGPRTDLVRKGRKRSKKPWLIALICLLVAALVAGAVVLATRPSKPGALTVPNVVNLPLSEARTQLLADGLVPGTVTSAVSSLPRDQVLSTNPGVGMAVSKGATVDLTVSDGSGSGQVPVPSVVGKLVGDAQSTLQKAGFQVTVQTSNVTPTGQNPSGTVLSQTPAGDSKAAKGSMVTLTVVGTPSQAYVPSLVGQQASAAAGLLSQAGLSLGSQSSACSNSYGAGIIVGSSPDSGTATTPGASVDITVSNGACQVTVPAFAGQTVGDYQATLSSINLVSAGGANCNNPASTVTATSPPPGTQVQSGQTVTLTCAPPTTTSSTSTTTTSPPTTP
jgi:serine/threonine-protein kinase